MLSRSLADRPWRFPALVARPIRSAAVALGIAGCLISGVPAAHADPGDPITQIIVPEPGCVGVGVAFDGVNVLYTCNGSNAIFMTDLAATDLGSVPVADASGNAVDLDAIAWDVNEGVLWGGETNTAMAGAGPGECGLWSVDLTTGLATPRLHFPDDGNDIVGTCGATFFDGITIDPLTDTIYWSADVKSHIHHVDKTGAPAANDGIDLETLTAGQCPWAQGLGHNGCLNSGLAIGLDGTLFAGTASDGIIWSLDPNVPSVLGQFATVSGRDEDLECGPQVINAAGATVETILSRDLSNIIDVLEAEPGTCISPTTVRVDKVYTFTNVCFEQDNDGDGLFNEDPVDFDVDSNPIDNDGDGLLNEDDVDCPDGTSLGDQLPTDADGNFVLEAVVHRNGRVSSYNPGQYYAVSSVLTPVEIETLWIEEHYGDCTEGDFPVSALNPANGGGAVVLVMVGPDGVARQIADANSPNVVVTDTNPANGVPDNAEAHLEDVPADTLILMYVKFEPGLKGLQWPGETSCENTNIAMTSEEDEGVSASAFLVVVEK